MPVVGKCALCGQTSELQSSHIIPQFATEFIKRTAGSPYLRQAVNPNERKQDGLKKHLLCSPCEGRFGEGERLFANRIFLPYHEQGERTFAYEEWLQYFVISLSWRMAVYHLEELRFRETEPDLAPPLETAMSHWRDYLLNDGSDPGPSAHHLFFTHNLSFDDDVDIPPMFFWYLLRGTDGTIATSQMQIQVYTMLPGMIFWSGVEPAQPEGWEDALVSDSGEIGEPQTISYPSLWGFLLSRVEESAQGRTRLSPRQKERLAAAMRNDPERLSRSRTLDVLLIERIAQRRGDGGNGSDDT